MLQSPIEANTCVVLVAVDSVDRAIVTHTPCRSIYSYTILEYSYTTAHTILILNTESCILGCFRMVVVVDVVVVVLVTPSSSSELQACTALTP